MRRVLLAGGGTAGHTSPLLATADALRRRNPGLEVTALGTPRGLETTVIPAAGYPLELVTPVPLSRRLGPDLLRTPARLKASRDEALAVLDRVRPDVVVGFGGYVSVPAYLAARRRGVPIVVHEGNAIAGIANRLGARMTRHVATSFPATELPHAVCTGLPIRRLISTMDRPALRAEALSTFGLRDDLPVRDVHERLGRGPDHVEGPALGILEGVQVHVGARVDRSQHAIDLERVGRALGLEAP